MGSARRWVLLLAGSLLLPGPALAQDFAAKGFKVAPATPRESTPENVAAGKALYEDNCTQCHGAEGDGQGAMADLAQNKLLIRQYLGASVGGGGK